MRKLALVILISLVCLEVFGQCINTYAYGTVNAPTNGAVATITTTQWAGDYATINLVEDSTKYKISSNVNTDFITITKGSYNGEIIACGNTPLIFTTKSDGSGIYFFHFNTNSTCGVEEISRTTKIEHQITYNDYNSLYLEKFNNNLLPTNWIPTNIGNVKILVVNSNRAGGNREEVVFDCMTTLKSDSSINRLYYGPIDVSSYSNIKLKWKQYLSHFSDVYNYNIKIETSTDAINWHPTTWFVNPVSTNINPGNNSLIISNSDVGSSFYICFTLSGNAYGCNYWYLDNVEILGTPIPLPIDLLSFTVSCEHHTALLQWSTATETNNSHFLLQRSNDAINFETFATVNGSGNSNQELKYSYIDDDTHAYYRLVQVDYDNTETTFDIVATNCDNVIINVQPNPFSENTTLTVSSDLIGTDIYIHDATGALIEKKTIKDVKTIIEIESTGIYIISFQVGDKILTKKIFKI